MIAVRMDGGLLLMPMLLVHAVHPAEAVPAALIGEADEVRSLRVQRRTGAVQRLSDPHSTGEAQPLHGPHRPEALR